MIKRGISVESSKEEEKGEEESSAQAMEIEGQFKELPPPTDEEPSTQVHQYQLQEGQPMQEEHPSQEGPSS